MVVGYHTTSDSGTIHESFASVVEMQKKITQQWKLSYKFYPHFHPYIPQLIKQLVEKSVPGLQAADTEYVAKENGTLAVLRDSTLVSLDEDVSTEFSGQDLTIARGTQIFLPDGTTVALPNSPTIVTIPGTMVVLTQKRGMRFQIPGGSTEDVSFDDNKLTLTKDVNVRIPEGLLVTLPANTKIVLHDCKPKPVLYEDIFSDSQYHPSPDLVERPYPVKDLDFTSSGAYSVYNWELFYHVPITIAIHLSKNQRFEEAQKWLHYIFDPTDSSDGPTPERFWKVKPFQYTDIQLIEEILVNLSSKVDPKLRDDTVRNINAWKENPFRPHLIARYRHTAYMFKAVMAYLDNLIAWGDTLFRQDTGETINEATQVYVLAANILGPKPQAVPKKGSVRPQTYADIKARLDEFGNVLVDLEPEIPFDAFPYPNEAAADLARLSVLSSIGTALYFCIPRNDKLLSYWDTVADRLFKIRNSLNIQGIFRQLPLFEPPIDPALLAKAAAAGLDVGAIIAGLNQPLPLVRFQFLVQKAAEICQEVRTLGNDLLSALEKEDNEALAILRAKHEQVILEMAETVKYAQLQEATKTLEGLQKSQQNAILRYTYYEMLLGEKEGDILNKIPELGSVETADIEDAFKKKLKFAELGMGEPRTIVVDIAADPTGEGGGKKLSTSELGELTRLKDAQGETKNAGRADQMAADFAVIPTFGVEFEPLGTGGSMSFGGGNLSAMGNAIAVGYRNDANELSYEASKFAKIGVYEKRELDWAFQSNLAAADIEQISKQLRAAQIRVAISDLEWKNHKQQIKHNEEIEHFLLGEETSVGENKHKKTSTQAFYAWMKGEVRGLYSQCFQFAFDVAKKAERALQYELGDPSLSFLQFGYLAGKEGLLAGEKLYLDIKRMEMAYHDLNQREYELTKHVSLLQVNPYALLELRTKGSCTVYLPEELFDMDCPGHYFRRIKSVALSIPSVTGPYTSVNCTLTLLKSSIRKTPLLRDGQYAREGVEDDRFSDHFGSMQSIVTSSAQSDSGLFETNLRDERYLPFEGSGVVSEWRLELPSDIRQFDYDTISDVILHLRYTAREAGGMVRIGAVENLKAKIDEAQAAGSVRLFSIRHEFPTEWAKFTSIEEVDSNNPAELKLELKPEHYPFWSKDRLEAIKRVELFAETKDSVEVSLKVDANGLGAGKITLDVPFGKLKSGVLVKSENNLSPIGSISLYFGNNSMEDLLLALTWGK